MSGAPPAGPRQPADAAGPRGGGGGRRGRAGGAGAPSTPTFAPPTAGRSASSRSIASSFGHWHGDGDHREEVDRLPHGDDAASKFTATAASRRRSGFSPRSPRRAAGIEPWPEWVASEPATARSRPKPTSRWPPRRRAARRRSCSTSGTARCAASVEAVARAELSRGDRAAAARAAGRRCSTGRRSGSHLTRAVAGRDRRPAQRRQEQPHQRAGRLPAGDRLRPARHDARRARRRDGHRRLAGAADRRRGPSRDGRSAGSRGRRARRGAACAKPTSSCGCSTRPTLRRDSPTRRRRRGTSWPPKRRGDAERQRAPLVGASTRSTSSPFAAGATAGVLARVAR